MMKIYYVELYGGRCGLRVAASLGQATREALKTEGSNNVSGVSLATDEEISWVKAMGGYVPDVKKG